MAFWLSVWRMNRRWRRLFSQAFAVLGLLLVASLAHAGSACAPAFGAETPGLRAVDPAPCLSGRPAFEACIVIPQRIDVRVAAAAPSSPEPPAAAGPAEHSTGMFRTVAARQSPAGLAPAFPVPVYILLRRYLS